MHSGQRVKCGTFFHECENMFQVPYLADWPVNGTVFQVPYFRREYVVNYEEAQISLAYLERRAPFVAYELTRQSRLRPEDRR
jgi:hypothetical protein